MLSKSLSGPFNETRALARRDRIAIDCCNDANKVIFRHGASPRRLQFQTFFQLIMFGGEAMKAFASIIRFARASRKKLIRLIAITALRLRLVSLPNARRRRISSSTLWFTFRSSKTAPRRLCQRSHTDISTQMACATRQSKTFAVHSATDLCGNLRQTNSFRENPIPFHQTRNDN